MAQKCRFSQRLASLEANSGGGGGLLTPCLVGGSALGSCYAMGFVPFPEYFIGNAMIFVLASVLGYCLCANVKPSLHTPLMSGANAIHGIILLGAVIVTGTTESTVALVVGLVAIVLAAINMVGGFVVTDRMLQMFSRRKPRPAPAERAER